MELVWNLKANTKNLPENPSDDLYYGHEDLLESPFFVADMQCFIEELFDITDSYFEKSDDNIHYKIIIKIDNIKLTNDKLKKLNEYTNGRYKTMSVYIKQPEIKMF